MNLSRRGFSAVGAALLVGLGGCSGEDSTRLYDAAVGSPAPRPRAYLNFPPEARQAPMPGANNSAKFPRLLSETGAFRDLTRMEASAGLVPYDLQSPLWSDGAEKRRWLALPELGSVRVSADAPWRVPPGTVFIKHFEMPLDERQPGVRRRLETRLLIAAQTGSFYGVTYKWNTEETDAEIVLEPFTEQLSMIDADGEVLQQPYFYPGPRDCITCHTSSAGYVLGLRTRQLNHEFSYGSDQPPVNELVAWSDWGLLDRSFSEAEADAAPRLAYIADENVGLEQRVRSYWDSNCSMCHAGSESSEGSAAGWDARFFIPLEELGLDQPPQMRNPELPAALVEPGSAKNSSIYVRSATAEKTLRMPPIGRNRIDQAYVDVLARWIDSLALDPRLN